MLFFDPEITTSAHVTLSFLEQLHQRRAQLDIYETPTQRTFSARKLNLIQPYAPHRELFITGGYIRLTHCRRTCRIAG